MSELGTTVFENNRRDFIRNLSHPRIKAREGMENIIMKNFYLKNEVVRGWRSKRNMPSTIQCIVSSKCLSEKFSFRERRDSFRAIWLKYRRKDDVELSKILMAICQKS